MYRDRRRVEPASLFQLAGSRRISPNPKIIRERNYFAVVGGAVIRRPGARSGRGSPRGMGRTARGITSATLVRAAEVVRRLGLERARRGCRCDRPCCGRSASRIIFGLGLGLQGASVPDLIDSHPPLYVRDYLFSLTFASIVVANNACMPP